MRLGQLSRKVDTKPSVIISYLKSEFDITIGTHLNSKVEDALAEKVIKKFGREVPEEVKKSDSKKKENPKEVKVEESTLATAEAPSPKTTPVEIAEVSEDLRLNAEVIKAPKIELEGPKVIGKIELPPSPEEQMVEIDGVMMTKAELAKRKREERLTKREKRSTKEGNSAQKARKSAQKSEEQMAQLKRDQEAKELADKIARREKRIQQQLKQKKKLATAQKVNKKDTPRKVFKKQVVPKIENPEKPKIHQPEPSTWWGKLWRWFNT
jgi:hypothetical protein